MSEKEKLEIYASSVLGIPNISVAKMAGIEISAHIRKKYGDHNLRLGVFGNNEFARGMILTNKENKLKFHVTKCINDASVIVLDGKLHTVGSYVDVIPKKAKYYIISEKITMDKTDHVALGYAYYNVLPAASFSKFIAHIEATKYLLTEDPRAQKELMRTVMIPKYDDYEEICERISKLLT